MMSAMPAHRESPIKRVNPSGKVRWVARYTDSDGKRRSAGTFAKQREAQAAMDQAYDRPARRDTLGAYAREWTARHPRSERTNVTNDGRVAAVLEVRVDGRRLADWPLTELRRRHAVDLVEHMLTVQGRAATGATNILRNFYRDVWRPAREVSGIDCSPHDFRHSYVTHLRAAGVDPADLAAMAGHSVETATSRYTHALGRSFDEVRRLVG